MNAILFISPLSDIRKNIIEEELKKNGFSKNHPDLLYLDKEQKLGIVEARKIKEHFYLKPFSARGKGAALEDVSVMTKEAQNALLKTLEELPENAVLILGTPSDANILPTVLSRCQTIHLQNPSRQHISTSEVEIIKQLISVTTEERFSYIEKLKDKEKFLHSLTCFFHQELIEQEHKTIISKFLNELLQAEQWAKQNVNIRAVLEYLMLVMPSLESSR